MLVLAAACGGGGGGGSTPATSGIAATTPSPSASATLPASTSATATAGTTASLATVTGGYSGTVTLPAAVSGSGVTTLSLSTNGVALASSARLPAAIGASGLSALAYVTLTTSAGVTFATFPSFTFTVPSTVLALPSGATFSLAYNPDNGSGHWSVLETGTVAGTVVTFTGAPGPVTFAAGTTYAFAIFATAQTLPAASPSPSPSPSPSVSGTIVQGTAYPCSDTQFASYQSQFAAQTISADQFVDVCGVVQSVLPQAHTSSGNHGYFYLELTSGYQIEIVSNLDAMAEAATHQPPVPWPWVSAGKYAYVQGRYYYDNANAQGIDWTEDDTSNSWQHVGYVAVCDATGLTCSHYW